MTDISDSITAIENQLSAVLSNAKLSREKQDQTGIKTLMSEYIQLILNLEQTDKRKSVMFIRSASIYSLEFFKISKDSYWLEMEYKLRINLAENKDADPEMPHYDYIMAGKCSRLFYLLTNDIEWGIRWYNSVKNSGRVMENIDKELSAKSYGFSADAARKIFEKTKDVEWIKKAYENDWISAKRLEECSKTNVNQKKSDELLITAAFTYGFAGEDARKVVSEYENNEDYENNNEIIKWTERWYHADLVSAILTRESDSKHSAFSYLFAADAARKRAEIDLDKEWFYDAFRFYQNFLSYAEKNLKNKEGTKEMNKIRENERYCRKMSS